MKRRILTAVALIAATLCAHAQGDVMKYRIVPVSNSAWMSSKESDREAVRAQIDAIVEGGYNVISIGTFYFMPQYFVDYSRSPYPEAAEFTPEKVEANRAAIRENICYAKQRGIRTVVSRSYSHYAPVKFWQSHSSELNPEGMFDTFLEKAHQNDKYRDAMNGKSGSVVPHQQWTNDTFREFYLWSTARTLELIPELDGFLNAYAEAAWTLDEDAVRRGEWSSWKECIDYSLTDSCFVDYSNRLAAMLRARRGDDYFFGMRDWYVSPEVLARLSMPKDKLVISVKYAGYDQPLAGCPPWAHDLLGAGFGVLMDMHVYDAEYPSPVYWYSADFVERMFEGIHSGGYTGVVYQDYTLRGEDKADNPIRRLTQHTVSAAMNRMPITEADAERFLEPHFKKGTKEVLRSLADVAKAQETYIKMMPAWFWRGDGLSVGGVQPPQAWMMADNPEALDRMGYVRQDVVGVPEYMEAFWQGTKAFDAALERWKREGRITPPEVNERMEALADDAVEAILAARKLAPARTPYMKDLVASAFIHRQLVIRNASYTRAVLALYKSGYVYNNKYEPSRVRVHDTGLDLRNEFVAEMERYMAADLLMRRLMLDYAPRRRTLRHKNTYDNEKKLASVMKVKLEIPEVDMIEFEKISQIIQER